MTSATADRDTWLRRYHPCDDGGPQLVCFPHAGGSASYFFPLSALLAPDVEVLAAQYPGRQDRRHEPGVESIDALAASLAPLLNRPRERPYAFFGHSMGAVVAYEVCRRMSASGVPGPDLLIASGRRAPSRYRPSDVHRRSDEGLLDE